MNINEQLRVALRCFVGAAYPVATSINPRGYNWSEAYLDEALPDARAALAAYDALPVVDEREGFERWAEPHGCNLSRGTDGEYLAAWPKTAWLAWQARAALAQTAPPADAPTFPAGLHPRTADLVRRFSVAMAEKLFAAQQKYGYSDGWANDDWLDECRAHLLQHVAKGDPRDVANYSAFLWHHGASTAGATADARDANKDTGRMDFAERYLFGSTLNRRTGVKRFFPRARSYPELKGASLRVAIDSAMGAKDGQS